MGLTLRPVGSESKAGGTARSTSSGVGLAAPATTSASRVPVMAGCFSQPVRVGDLRPSLVFEGRKRVCEVLYSVS